MCGFNYDLVNWCPLKYLATNDCFHLIFNVDKDGINLHLVIKKLNKRGNITCVGRVAQSV